MVIPGRREKVLGSERGSAAAERKTCSVGASLGIAKRDDEGVSAMNDALNDQLSEYGAVSGGLSGT